MLNRKAVVNLFVCVSWLTIVAVGGRAYGERESASTSDRDSPQNQVPSDSEAKLLDREGDLIINKSGLFKDAGDRVVFVSSGSQGKESYQVLENLALERISRMLQENTAQREWSVSGKVTEFRGDYYLLVTRAVLKSKAIPRSTGRASEKPAARN